ncbi:aldose epimerase family protein [Tabrizicola sp. BL-A-41-H6]|uniref:aldose epimerase family protein n=1 Tax=Tabrizicola sp. BL-A-41-H6 TaxID=3421107 RepID=UPI003D66A175
MADVTIIGQIDGRDIKAATLFGPGGLRVVLLTYGARLAELWVPDRDGSLADIVLGHDDLQDWRTQGGYLGATCGRYSNRIADGRFVLDGRAIKVDQNEGNQHLHGGRDGFDRKLWTIDSHSAQHVTFAAASPDGEMGYPGAVTMRTTYRIDAAGGLVIEMTAKTNTATVINMVNHAYFNLAGQGAGDVMGQLLSVCAGFYLPVDDRLIPTGEVRPVTGTAFDFRALRPIGALLPGPGGFDHNLCLSAPVAADGLRPCLQALDPVSGRRITMSTTEPGVQLYTGAHFDATPGKAGQRYARFAGFAVETQRFPDSPNNPHFPSARLAPGETYRHVMRFDFCPAPR